MELIHGGDITGIRMQFGDDALDFSANLNPFGMPEGVRQAAKDAVDNSQNYPDPLCRQLTKELARHLGLPDQWFVFGNGAADIIFRLAMAKKPKRALLTAPGFAEYASALNGVGCQIDYHYTKEKDNFILQESFLDSILPEYDMILLCEPNNPTGTITHRELLEAVAEKCKRNNIFLFVDECFSTFITEDLRHSFLPKLRNNSNLFVLGSFTKLYAMAGIRLGYGICSDTGLMRSLINTGQPWSVSTIAQQTGVAALKEEQYVEDSLKFINTERSWLMNELGRLGIKVYPSKANYVFFHTPHPHFAEKLANQGIFIRDCSNYKGLEKGYYRAAVRLREENVKLLKAINNILS